ncbi:MAG: hypothetical protein QNJ34_05075 [Xenococcaceae cyanobacterium MO_188.B29]|nr:hypothetical protein [Xenococcaceae cyanobacterium MO_188.B29]
MSRKIAIAQCQASPDRYHIICFSKEIILCQGMIMKVNLSDRTSLFVSSSFIFPQKRACLIHTL